jgi:hypothetical protein
MDDKQLAQFTESMQKTIADSIESNVNGKIRGLDKRVSEYILADTLWKESDLQWKNRSQPSIDLGANLIAAAKVLGYIAGGAAAVFGILKLVEFLIKR